MAYLQTVYADKILNQDGDDLITSQVVLEDDASALVAASYKHLMRKVRTIAGSVVTTKYERSIETGTDTWSWVTLNTFSYTTA